MPYWGGIGNAWQWAYSGYHSGGNKVSYNSGNWHTANSQTYGVPSGSTPKKGSVAVRNANPSGGDPWGHTAWVEEVYGNGTIRISQYNWYNAGGSGWGHYSEMVVNSSFFGQYLYFGDK
jgi:surface antigen